MILMTVCLMAAGLAAFIFSYFIYLLYTIYAGAGWLSSVCLTFFLKFSRNTFMRLFYAFIRISRTAAGMIFWFVLSCPFIRDEYFRLLTSFLDYFKICRYRLPAPYILFYFYIIPAAAGIWSLSLVISCYKRLTAGWPCFEKCRRQQAFGRF